MANHEKLGKCTNHGIMISPVQQMIASGTGAIFTSILVTPLDVVKIRLQAQKKPNAFTNGKCFMYCNGLMDHMCTCINGPAPPVNAWYKRTLPSPFVGTTDAFMKIVRHEGMSSLWSGLTPTLAMAIPATVVYFTCYEHMKALMNYNENCPSQWWKPVISASLARVWAVTLISPIEMVRTKLQSQSLTYQEVGLALRNSVQAGGLLVLWRGLGPTLFRDVPFSGLYWLNYESMKSWFLQTSGRSELLFAESFAAGACSGTAAAIVTLPFDVVKTHRQVDLGMLDNKDLRSPTSSWTLIKHLYRAEGLNGLFAGTVPRITKVAPACAIMVSSYEYLKQVFRNSNQLSFAAAESARR